MTLGQRGSISGRPLHVRWTIAVLRFADPAEENIVARAAAVGDRLHDHALQDVAVRQLALELVEERARFVRRRANPADG
jgi:hypothetical protein